MSFETFTLALPSVVLEVAGKGALISLGVLGMVALLRRSSAASRHLLLVLAAGCLLLLPVFAVGLPSRELAVLPAERVGGVESTDGHGLTRDGHGLAQTVTTQRVQRAAPPASLRLPVASGFALFVLAVSGLLLVRLTLAVRRLAKLSAGSLAAPQAWAEIFEELKGRLEVRLGISPAVAVPVTFGWRRPVVLLPEAARGWSDAQLREALLHELAHVRRHDWALQMIVRAARALHWFDPLVWWLSRRLLLEAELACDDQVLRAGAGPADYAGRLVALAREVRSARPAEAVAFARPSGLSSRVAAILDPGRRRGGPCRLALVGATASALILLALVAPARLVRAEQRAASLSSSPAPLLPEPLYQKAVREGVEGGIADGIAGGIADGVADGVKEGKQEALIEAAEHGDVEAVRFLLGQGADPNGAVSGDGSPLIAAAGKGREDIVTLLLEQGADPNLGVRGDGSPLIAAAEGGHVEVVRTLLEAGADVDQVVPGDENPLIQAAWKGRLEVVRTLLDANADPNVRVMERDELRTPLRMARRGGHRDVERLLLERGARE